MSTWITRFDGPELPGARRVAVKDVIDVEGWPTTAGCRVRAARAKPAERDAACLAGIRAAERAGRVQLVGKTNLHELAYGVSGINPWYGTPPNPLDPAWVPGGSSSGSAVAVGAGEADVALGSDTGGSIRIPAACCGVVGLKPTWGRIPLDGVYPLAPSLDTVGPMARDVTGVVEGMALLEPGFVPARGDAVRRVGRVRLPAASGIDRAVDEALAAAGWDAVDVDLPDWQEADAATLVVMGREAWQVNGSLVGAHPGELGADVEDRLVAASRLSTAEVAEARAVAVAWRRSLAAVFEQVDLLAWPTIADPPPPLEEASRVGQARYTLPVNLAGIPAIALPLPAGVTPRGWPPSVQLAGPVNKDALVVGGALRLEAAAS